MGPTYTASHAEPNAQALGFHIAWMSANGDLDDDDTNGTFELAVAVHTDLTLYHARGFFVVNEIE